MAGHRPPPSSPVVRRPAARSSATPNASSSAWFAAHRRTYRRAWGCAASPRFPPPSSDTFHDRNASLPTDAQRKTNHTPTVTVTATPTTSVKLDGHASPCNARTPRQQHQPPPNSVVVRSPFTPPSIPYALYPTTLATLPKYKGRAMPRPRPLFIQTYPICLTGRYVVYQRHPVAHPWLEYGEMRPLGPRRNATATQRLVDIVACTLPSPRIFLLL